MTVVENLNANLQRLLPDFPGFEPAAPSGLGIKAKYHGVHVEISDTECHKAWWCGNDRALELLALKILNR